MQSMKAWEVQKFRGHHISPATVGESQPVGDPMDWEPIQPINIAVAHPNSARQPSQTTRARAARVLHKEIGRRMSEGLCIRCGG